MVVTKGKQFLGYDLSDPVQLKKFETHLFNEVRSGKTFKEALQLSDGLIEQLYSLAYNLYTQGRYPDSITVFKLLVFLDPMSFRYQFGLAACMQLIEEYMEAVRYYSLAALIEKDNPLPEYYGGECLLRLKKKGLALQAFQVAILKAKGKPEYQKIAQRAEMLRDAISEDVRAYIKKESPAAKASSGKKTAKKK